MTPLADLGWVLVHSLWQIAVLWVLHEPLVQAGVTVVHERSEVFHFTMVPNYTADDAALCPAGRDVLRVCTAGDVPGS